MSSRAHQVGATLFLSLFVAMGLLFAVRTAARMYPALRTSGWTPVECRILASEIQEDDAGPEGRRYRLAVEFAYAVEGTQYHATTLGPGYQGSHDLSESQRLA